MLLTQQRYAGELGFGCVIGIKQQVVHVGIGCIKGKDCMGVITPLPRLHHGGSLITEPLFLSQRLTTHAPGMKEIKPVDVGYYFVYIVCEDLQVHSLIFKHETFPQSIGLNF